MIHSTLYPLDMIDSDLLAELRRLYPTITYDGQVEWSTARQHIAWESKCEAACVAAQDAGQPEPTFEDFKADTEHIQPERYPAIVSTYEQVRFRLDPCGLLVINSMTTGCFTLLDGFQICDGSKPTTLRLGQLGFACWLSWLYVDPAEPRNFADQFNTEFE